MAESRRGRQSRLAQMITTHASRSGRSRAALADVCEVCAEVVAVTGASIWLAANAQRRALAYASDKVSRDLDELQITLDEGPCVDAWEDSGPILVGDLTSVESSDRWPRYTPAALAAGARAVFAFPLRSGAIASGVLQLHREETGELGPGQVADALSSASLALDIVLGHLTPNAARNGMLPWKDGIDMGAGRAAVYQATGMVSVQLGVGLEGALVALRDYAVRHDRTLTGVATDVVARRIRFARPSGIA